MLGPLAPSQESSECEVSLKGVLHQPAARAPPGSSGHSGDGRSPTRLPGPGACGPPPLPSSRSCALLQERKLRVFSLPSCFSFLKTKVLSLHLPASRKSSQREGGFGPGREGRGRGAIAPRSPQPYVWGGRICVVEGGIKSAKFLGKRRQHRGPAAAGSSQGLSAGGGAGGRAGLRPQAPCCCLGSWVWGGRLRVPLLVQGSGRTLVRRAA